MSTEEAKQVASNIKYISKVLDCDQEELLDDMSKFMTTEELQAIEEFLEE